jgi:hypothetical protein
MTTLSQAEFARKHGISRVRVTHLKHQGRLVLDDAGKVIEDATLARIRETANPSHSSKLDRPAAGVGAIHESPAPPPPIIPPESRADARSDADAMTYQQARSLKEQYLALAARQAYEVATGELVPVSDYRHSVTSAGITFRKQLENLAPRLAPELAAESDVARVRALLTEAVEAVLLATAEEFERQEIRLRPQAMEST